MSTRLLRLTRHLFVNTLKYFLLVIVVITFGIPKATQCTEEESQESLALINSSVRDFANSIKDKTGLDKWAVVNEECKSQITQHTLEQYKINILVSAMSHVFSVDQEICEAFLKIGLKFTPNPNNDLGQQVELWIKDLDNPLEGKFQGMNAHLSISTGYRKKKDLANEDLIEVWLLPRFVMEAEINKGNAPHLAPIFNKYGWPIDATVGIFCTRGNASDNYLGEKEVLIHRYDMGAYGYVTELTMDVLCGQNLNLYEIWNGDVKARRQGSKRRTRNHSTNENAREMMKYLRLIKVG